MVDDGTDGEQDQLSTENSVPMAEDFPDIIFHDVVGHISLCTLRLPVLINGFRVQTLIDNVSTHYTQFHSRACDQVF